MKRENGNHYSPDDPRRYRVVCQHIDDALVNATAKLPGHAISEQWRRRNLEMLLELVRKDILADDARRRAMATIRNLRAQAPRNHGKAAA